MTAYAYAVLKEQDDHDAAWMRFEEWSQSLAAEEMRDYLIDYLEQLNYATGPVYSSMPTSVDGNRPTATVKFRGMKEFEWWLFDTKFKERV